MQASSSVRVELLRRSKWVILSLLALLACLAPSCSGERVAEPLLRVVAGNDFLRYVERDDGSAALQTSIINYRNGDGSSVSLLSAVHLGEASYYVELNERLARFRRVLHEPARLEGAPSPPPLSSSTRYQMGLLELESELEAIDYTPPHFLEAGLTLEEFWRLQEERGNLNRIIEIEPVDQATRDEMRSAMNAEDRARELRMVSARLLAQQVDDMAEDGVWLLTAANRIAIEALRDRLERGESDIALYYGAAHGRDWERRLFELAFERYGKPEFLDAWAIDPPG